MGFLWIWTLRHANRLACRTSGTPTSLRRTAWAGSRWFHLLRPQHRDDIVFRSGDMATLCRRESRLPLLCPVQVSNTSSKNVNDNAKYYNAERKATTELGDVPNPPFLTNSCGGVSTITTTKAQANVFLSPKESLPERLQFQKRSQCCWRWNDSQLGSKCVNILERELQLKLHIHDRIIQISILFRKGATSEKDQNRRWLR